MRAYLARIASAFADGIEKWAARQERSSRLRAFGWNEADTDLLVTSVVALGFTPDEAIEVLSEHVRHPERAR